MKDYEFYGGFPPYARGSDTSMLAAMRQLPKAETKRQEVYKCIWQVGSKGATDEEVASIMGDPTRNTVGPRRRELVLAGLVEDSGMRRPTTYGCSAIVWRVKVKEEDEGEGK